MLDQEFEFLRAELQRTARYSAPSVAKACEWVRALDTAGGPDRWYKASLYFAEQAEICRRFGIPHP